MRETAIAYEEVSPFAFQQTLEKARKALADSGFGILCEIDVQATLKKKLGVDWPPYVILGACHAPSAYEALEQEPQVGVLLPCNVTVSEEQGRVVVRAMRPAGALSVLQNPKLERVGEHVGGLLREVVRKTCQD